MGIESSKVIAQDMVRVTAVARVVYESFTADTQKKAINLAKKTALKKYFRKLPTAKKRQLKAFEGEFYKNMDDFITEVKIQQEKLQPQPALRYVVSQQASPGRLPRVGHNRSTSPY